MYAESTFVRTGDRAAPMTRLTTGLVATSAVIFIAIDAQWTSGWTLRSTLLFSERSTGIGYLYVGCRDLYNKRLADVAWGKLRSAPRWFGCENAVKCLEDMFLKNLFHVASK